MFSSSSLRFRDLPTNKISRKQCRINVYSCWIKRQVKAANSFLTQTQTVGSPLSVSCRFARQTKDVDITPFHAGLS
jgi:hypothetical protein